MKQIKPFSYPIASSIAVLNRMKSQARSNTMPEMVLRKKLYSKGIRYRVNCRPIKDLNTKADMIIKRAKVAIFVDGCFWHVCPWHKSFPKNNAHWWESKLMRNRLRDQVSRKSLKKNGWKVIRVWTHSDMDAAANKILNLLNKPA